MSKDEPLTSEAEATNAYIALITKCCSDNEWGSAPDGMILQLLDLLGCDSGYGPTESVFMTLALAFRSDVTRAINDPVRYRLSLALAEYSDVELREHFPAAKGVESEFRFGKLPLSVDQWAALALFGVDVQWVITGVASLNLDTVKYRFLGPSP